MRLRTLFAGLFVALSSIVVLSYGSVSATPLFQSDDNLAATGTAKDQVVDGSAYLAGTTVRVDGYVKGDLYCAGNSVTVRGTVEGDVLCAAGTIVIDGTVNGDIRAAGSTIIINGTIEGSATVAASDITISSDASIGRDLTGGAEVLVIDGLVGRDMLVGASEATITGSVGRHVIAGIERLSITDSAKIGGDVTYKSDRTASIADGAVAGEVSFTQVSEQDRNANYGMMGVAGALMVVLAIGLLAFIGAVWLPRAVEQYANVSWAQYGIAAVVGLTTLVIAPVLSLLMFLTGFGVAIGYVVLLAWLLLMAMSPVWFAYFLGSRVYAKRSSNILIRATVGALVLMLLLLLPIVNVIVFLLMLFVGVGLPLLAVPKMFTGKLYEAGSTEKKTEVHKVAKKSTKK